MLLWKYGMTRTLHWMSCYCTHDARNCREASRPSEVSEKQRPRPQFEQNRRVAMSMQVRKSFVTMCCT